MAISLTLPEPPSANRYWRVARGRPYLSAEARAYKMQVQAVLLLAGIKQIQFPKGQPISVTVHWYRSRRSGDLDNRFKCIGDALNGLLWADDQQITELHLFRHDRPRDGALLLTVEALPE